MTHENHIGWHRFDMPTGLVAHRETLSTIAEYPSLPGQEKIRQICSDRITWEEVPLKFNGNCFAYALGLLESNYYCEVAEKDRVNEGNKYYATSGFIKFLIDNQRLNPTSLHPGSVVIYRNDENYTHAGIVRDIHTERVGLYCIQSKWGNITKDDEITGIFIHLAWKVPSNYGDEVAFFTKPSLEEMEQAFREYVYKLDSTTY